MDANVATYRSSGFRKSRLLALWAAGLCWSTGAAFARPTKVFLHPASDVIVAGGHAFGSGGAYEKVRGTVEFQIDPTDPRNAGITDLELAPRNADGLVSFDADYMLLYPADLSTTETGPAANEDMRPKAPENAAFGGAPGGSRTPGPRFRRPSATEPAGSTAWQPLATTRGAGASDSRQSQVFAPFTRRPRTLLRQAMENQGRSACCTRSGS